MRQFDREDLPAGVIDEGQLIEPTIETQPSTKRPIWHPQIYQRYYEGGLSYFFLSSYFVSEIDEGLSEIFEELKITSYASHTLFGPRDILLCVHIPTIEDENLSGRLDRMMRGAGTTSEFKVTSVLKLAGEAVDNSVHGALYEFDPVQLAKFQDDPTDRDFERRLRERQLIVGYEDITSPVRAYTIFSLVVAEEGQIRRILSSLNDIARENPEFGRAINSVYSGNGYGNIMIEWATRDTEQLHEFVFGNIHQRILRLVPAARTDTYIVAHTSHDSFNFVEFRPPQLGDVMTRLQRLYPTFSSLGAEEQQNVTGLYIAWKLWMNRRDGLASRFIEGIIESDLRRQLNVVAEVGDRLEEALRQVLIEIAKKLWNEEWRQQLMQHVSKGNKPPERMNLGELVEGGAKIVKMASDKGIETQVIHSEFQLLREFVGIRNLAVHQASRDEVELRSLPEEAARILTRIFPLYYRLEER